MKSKITNLSSSLFNVLWMLMRWRKSRLNVKWRGLWVPKHPFCRCVFTNCCKRPFASS